MWSSWLHLGLRKHRLVNNRVEDCILCDKYFLWCVFDIVYTVWGDANPVVKYLERVFDFINRLMVLFTFKDVQTFVGGNVYLVAYDVYRSDLLVTWQLFGFKSAVREPKQFVLFVDNHHMILKPVKMCRYTDKDLFKCLWFVVKGIDLKAMGGWVSIDVE